MNLFEHHISTKNAQQMTKVKMCIRDSVKNAKQVSIIPDGIADTCFMILEWNVTRCV